MYKRQRVHTIIVNVAKITKMHKAIQKLQTLKHGVLLIRSNTTMHRHGAAMLPVIGRYVHVVVRSRMFQPIQQETGLSIKKRPRQQWEVSTRNAASADIN